MSKPETIFVKNMVCPRCISVVRQELTNIGYKVLQVDLGFAEIEGLIDKVEISKVLLENGFELLEDEKKKKVERVKTEIVALIHQSKSLDKINLSTWLSQKLQSDYSSLRYLFSAIENTTIEKFYILQRIEKVKELLAYDELSLKEIAFQLGFNSVAHLSAQFKKETGLTASHFKTQNHISRKSIDSF